MTLENHQKYLKYSPKTAKNILKLKVTAKKKKKKMKEENKFSEKRTCQDTVAVETSRSMTNDRPYLSFPGKF